MVIEGPKACGKTETAMQLAASSIFLDLDSATRASVDIDPRFESMMIRDLRICSQENDALPIEPEGTFQPADLRQCGDVQGIVTPAGEPGSMVAIAMDSGSRIKSGMTGPG